MIQMKKLDNKVSIVTGAGSGIGKAITMIFASEGSKVLATDINQKRLDDLEKEIGEMEEKGDVKTLISDMSKEEDIEKMIDVAKDTYGTLDILVNNAGIMDNFQPVAEVDDDLWNRVMNINVNGPFKAMRKAMKIFLQQESGVIINISSIGGLNGGRAGAAYTASKHALEGLTRNTGYVYSKSGIRCNAIAPGAIETSISETIDFEKVTPLIKDRIMSGMPLNPRSGQPEEIAKVALFLAGDESSFINGRTIVVDGGWSAY